MKRDDGRVKRSSGRYEANIFMLMMTMKSLAAAAPVGKSDRVLTMKTSAMTLRAVTKTRRTDERVKG